MNRFEKQLEKWNNGILRGAQAKLAKALRVTTATVALWATGKRHPSKGYLAKMAELFSLDEYSVSRLFADAGTYVSPYSTAVNSYSLCDRENVDFPTENTPLPRLEQTVSLPVFSKMPPAYPHFGTNQVHNWWTLPAKEAKKAHFLFLLPTPKDPARLLFVQPHNAWQNGKIMLGKQANRYLLLRATRAGNTWKLKPLEKEIATTKQLIPIGIVERQICLLKNTP